MADSEIYYALQQHNMYKLKKLIQTKTVCYNGNTVLHQALIYKKSKEIIQFLLEQGADVHAKNELGQTSLHVCYTSAGFCHFMYKSKITKLLIEYGFDIHAKDCNGETLLHTVCKQPSAFKMAELLLQLGISPNVESNDGSRPLHHAVKIETVETIKVLIDNGADINVQNKFGFTPLFFICRFNRVTTTNLEFLLEYDADVNAGKKDEETALYEALKMGNVEYVRLLLQRGANIHFAKSSIDKLYDSERKYFLPLFFQGLDIIRHHLIKLKYLKLINDSIFEIWRFSTTEKHEKFDTKCKMEFAKLCRLITPNRTARYCDLLTKSFGEVAILLNVNEIDEKLKEIDYEEDFPVYCDLLVSKIKKCKDLAKLLSEGYESFQVILKKFRMPDVVLENILTFFTKTDLQKLIFVAAALKK